MFSMVVPGSDFGKSFSTVFMHLFNPMVTVLLEYPNSVIYSCLTFAL